LYVADDSAPSHDQIVPVRIELRTQYFRVHNAVAPQCPKRFSDEDMLHYTFPER
jgi:hypothetical protein